MPLRILNDIHAGAIRSAGTTPATQWALRQHVLERLQELLPQDGSDLMLLGDLFDTGNVPMSDLVGVYNVLSTWLARFPNAKLYNVKGNHDESRFSNVLSSFQALGHLLSRHHANYFHIENPTMLEWGYVIPHVRNQETLDMVLKDVPECKLCFVHTNYDNNFAAQSDQSLNISSKQVRDSKVGLFVFAHEHHSKQVERVLIPGNQIATSVSDWLPKKDKWCIDVSDSGVCKVVKVAQRDDEYYECDWKALDIDKIAAAKFIRIVGEAPYDEATAVVNLVNKVRKNTDAFVVANAVSIQTEDGKLDLEATMTSVQSFNIMEALRKHFTPDEYKILETVCSTN